MNIVMIYKMSHIPWWKEKWGKDVVCCICQGRLRPPYEKSKPTKVVELPKCSHRLHISCYSLLVEKSTSNDLRCPLCRTAF